MTESFLINLLAYIIINSFLILGWYWFFKEKFNLQRRFNFILTFIFGITQIILTSFFLGLILKRLYPVELFTLNIGISLILLYVSRFRPKILLSKLKNFNNEFKKVNKRDIILWAFIILAIFTLTNLLILIIVHPPTSWDDYHYHLGFVADIIKTGQIRYFDYTHLYTISFPHDIELLDLWNMIFFRSDVLAEITNMYFLISLSGVIYLLCRHFGSKKRFAIIGGLLVYSIPILLLVSKTEKVDITMWTLLMASLYLLLNINFKEVFKRKNLTLFVGICLSLGIIFGSKSSAIIYVLVFYLGFLIVLFKQIGWRKIFKPLVILTGFIIVAMFVLGSFWYFRSWYYFGNPLFPVEFTVLGIHFPGEWAGLDFTNSLPQIESRNLIQRLIYVWEEREGWSGVYYIADGKLDGFGSIWFVFLLPSMLIVFLISILKKYLDLFIFIIVPTLILLVLPGNWIPHYTGFICIAGIIPFIYLLNKYITSKLGRYIVLIVLFLLFGLSFVLTIDGTFFRPVDTIKQLINADNISYASSLKTRDMNILINTTLGKNQSVVIGDKIWFPYALYNKDFSNDVVFVPARPGDDSVWLDAVAKVNPVYVVVLDGMPEAAIANKHPELFEKLITDIDGPHFLFAYKPNTSTKKTLSEKTFENDISKAVVIKDYKLTEVYGVKTFSIEFYLNKPDEIENPAIFFHIFLGNDETFVNLDFAPENGNGVMFGTQTIPLKYNSISKIRFGLTNASDLHTYAIYETNI
ncbi:MAG: hypothetical protein ABI721_04890 [Candidatus Dojkabacteria bacterium]